MERASPRDETAVHYFDHLSFFCTGCGLSLREAVENDAVHAVCSRADPKAYLIARHRMSVLVDPLLERLGFKAPDTKQ